MSTRLAISTAYAFASVLSLFAWRTDRSSRRQLIDPRDRAPFWPLTAVVLGIMALGRLSSAATSATGAGRRFAISEGWYDNRRPIQVLAVVGLALAWITTLRLVLTRQRGQKSTYLPMVVATTALLLLAVVRAISFHYVDSVLNRTRIGGARVGDLLEILGVAVAGSIAARAAFPGRSGSPTSVSSEASSG